MVFYKGNPFLYTCFHNTPRKIVGQRGEDEYMICGQMSILASSCPQCLSNSIPLLVNEDIIFFPLYFVDGFTTLDFLLVSPVDWRSQGEPGLASCVPSYSSIRDTNFQIYCFQSDVC